MKHKSTSSPMAWIAFIIGLAVFLWGVMAIAVSAGLTPFSLVDLSTPIGTVTTNDRKFGGGIIIAFLGVLLMYVSVRYGHIRPLS